MGGLLKSSKISMIPSIWPRAAHEQALRARCAKPRPIFSTCLARAIKKYHLNNPGKEKQNIWRGSVVRRNRGIITTKKRYMQLTECVTKRPRAGEHWHVLR